jgi:hypothetical protein
MPRPDLDYIADIIASTVETKQNRSRLENGMAIRQQMHAALNAGLTFEHYRSAWLSVCVQSVIDHTRELCTEFDKTHPEDAASILDMMDILVEAADFISATVRQKFTVKSPESHEPATPT